MSIQRTTLRRCLAVLAGLVFGSVLGWVSPARAACAGQWSWVSDNGYAGVAPAGEPAAVAAAYLATWGGNLTTAVVVAADGQSFTFGGGHYAATEYGYTFTGSGCSADPSASSSVPTSIALTAHGIPLLSMTAEDGLLLSVAIIAC